MKETPTRRKFKQYDEVFKAYYGLTLAAIEMHDGKKYTQEIAAITRWEGDTIGLPFHFDYTNEEIARAVYLASTASHWQMFRVGLKGLSTPTKLFCLRHRWANRSTIYSEEELKLEEIRINNYLGALIRSGYLNAELYVARY